MKFEFDPKHNIIVYDYHMHRPIYFLQKGQWYKVEGSCEGCKGFCCIKTPIPEFDDGTGKCKYLGAGCLIQSSNKPVGCAHFPSGTPSQYYAQLRKVMEEKCQLKIIPVK